VHNPGVNNQGFRNVFGSNGVAVIYSPEADAKTRDAASLLVKVLASHGIRGTIVRDDKTTPPNRVGVEVSDEPTKIAKP
jgi:hypothetical protein